MTKTAAEVMHDVIFAAVIDGVGALRTASRGLPNALLRDLNAIHPNTTFPDLPPELQAAIQASVRAAFTRLQSEGYTMLNPKVAATTRPQPKPAVPIRPNKGPDSGPRDPQRPHNNRRSPPRSR